MIEELQASILLVDDEQLNIEILEEYLKEESYLLTSCVNGTEAMKCLDEGPDKYDVVLLDRMMPDMDGFEVLKKMKADEGLKHIPVIVQTSKTSKEDILEGLTLGAHYYLTKPFEKEALLAVVKTAVFENLSKRLLKKELAKANSSYQLMTEGHFKFQTLDQCRNLASVLANLCPNPGGVVMGLSELMINGVEHGNLGISYDEKTDLMKSGKWMDEVLRRQELDENQGKFVTVDFKSDGEVLTFIIKDEGAGFNWESYLDIAPERIFDCHGRGIAMAKHTVFDALEYPGCGNEVHVTIKLNKEENNEGS